MCSPWVLTLFCEAVNKKIEFFLFGNPNLLGSARAAENSLEGRMLSGFKVDEFYLRALVQRPPERRSHDERIRRRHYA